MLAISEDAIICDLAETYHIYNYKELLPSMVATLCCGLGENSRIMRKLSKSKLTLTNSLLALLVDGVNILIWQNTKDGTKGRNKPESIYKRLTDAEEKNKEELMSFKSAESFERWYRSKRENHG